MECPVCKTELPDEANFCFRCGHALGEKDQSKKTEYIPDAERKRITALFSDISGYTAMTEKLDPEDVKEITSSIFDGAREVVAKYEGFIERFAGDGVLALFGVPKIHEDDPVRAVRAALEIHAFVKSLSPRYETKLNRSLSMHSGINTGLVITADVNPEKGTHGVTGDAINVAARLSDFASPGEIVVGLETQKATQKHFSYQTLKPSLAKGKSQPIQTYKLLHENKSDVSSYHRMKLSSEMVGRDKELAKLELHILKAVNGQGSIINVIGEPGIGKSRLIAELRKQDAINRVNILEGRSISIGKNLSFHPIINLYKELARIKEVDSSSEASNKLEIAIRRVCKNDADEVFPFIATMMGMKIYGQPAKRMKGIEGEALERLIYKNVRDLLIRSTEIIPIVIVMEDLHWADVTSLELLESLFRLSLTHPVLFVNIYRPGYWQNADRKIETIPDWLSEADFEEITLKPLDKNTGQILVDSMLQIKGVPSSVKQKIADRAGGNPFFIEEVVHSFIEEGAIMLKDGIFEVTDKINRVHIPTSINDVLLSRIDRLEEQTRELIKIASVIGRSFFDRIIKEVADSIDSVDERLTYLKDVQLIKDRTHMEELEYLFKHALAQEAAYESTLIQQRKLLHKKVAQAIEKVFNKRLHEFYGMLSFHFSKAENTDKAEEYLILAGEEAMKSSASIEALNYYQRALKSYISSQGINANPDRVSMMEKNICLSLYNKGSYTEALPRFDKWIRQNGIDLPEGLLLGAPKSLKSFIVLLISLYIPKLRWNKKPSIQEIELLKIIYMRLGMLIDVDSEKWFSHSLIISERYSKYDPKYIEDDSAEYISAISILFSWTGLSYALSRKILDFVKERYTSRNTNYSGSYQIVASIYNYMSGNWSDDDRFDKSILDNLVNVGNIAQAAHYIVNKGHIIIEKGETEQVRKLVQYLDRIRLDFDHDYSKILFYEIKLKYLLKYRKFIEAEDAVVKAVEFANEIGSELFVAYFNILYSRILALTERFEESRKILEDFDIFFRIEIKEPYYRSMYYLTKLYLSVEGLKSAVLKNQYALIRNNAKVCRKDTKKVLRFCKKAACDRIEGLRLISISFMLQGNMKKAYKYMLKSIGSGEQLGGRLELSRSYCEFGKLLLSNSDKYIASRKENGRKYLNIAYQMYEEMDLQWDLGMLHNYYAEIKENSETISPN